MYKKFKEDIERGKVGENVCITLFKNMGCEVNPVTEDTDFQKDDVDCLVEFRGQNEATHIEIKTDYQAHYTGNIAYEVISNIDYRTIGCFEKTKAKYICYVVYGNRKIYLLDTQTLKNDVKNHKGEYRGVHMGDNAWGYLIPIRTLFKRGNIIKRVYNFEVD